MRKKWQAEKTVPESRTIVRKYASRTADMKADVFVPFAQSGVGAVVLTLLALLKTRQLELSFTIGLVALLGVWIILLFDHRRSLWETAEEITGLDLNQDGFVGQKPAHVAVSVKRGQDRMQFIDLPVTEDELRKVAHLVLVRAKPFSRNEMSGVLSQTRFNELAATMENDGLIVKQSNNRRLLTDSGVELFKEVLYGNQ